jgi:ADP-heptose:LPS heptosyltransferase
VVWIRVGALGDLLVSLKALDTAFHRFPNAKFWIIGSKLWTEILDPRVWPQIDGILVSENGKNGSFFEPRFTGWVLRSPFLTCQELYRQADATVNLRIESYRFAWGPWRALVPTRIGSCPPMMKWLYSHWFPWLGKEPAIHERDWYDSVTKAQAGMSVDHLKLHEPKRTGLPALTLANKDRAEWLWGLQEKQFVLVNPTASRTEKAWPKEKFRELVRELSPRVQIIVTGAPSETEWLNFVADGKVRVIQPENLKDLFDLVQAAQFLICNTSSLQFVAAAQKTKALVLMGLTSPRRWGPLGPEDQVVEAPLKPSEVFDGKKVHLFERERLAYESIPLDSVLAALSPWLE